MTMDQRKRFFNYMEHISNQATSGMEKVTEYLEKHDYDDMDDDLQTFLLEHLDHYMNIVQYMEDYKEHHRKGHTKDCPDECDHDDPKYDGDDTNGE